jgi:hypothetical protein
MGGQPLPDAVLGRIERKGRRPLARDSKHPNDLGDPISRGRAPLIAGMSLAAPIVLLAVAYLLVMR